MEQLLETLPGLTAVFAFSDIMAIGAMRALRDHGLQVAPGMFRSAALTASNWPIILPPG